MEDFQFSPSSELGSRTFRGTYKGKEFAVRKFSICCDDGIAELFWEKLIKLRDDHLVQYHHVEIREDTRLLVMDLCLGSMLDYCDKTLNEKIGNVVMKANDIMWQMTCGLEFLHRLKITHGDLRLEKVLFWKKDSKSRRVIVKLTDYGFDFSKNRDDFKNDVQKLSWLFYAAASKEKAKPDGSINHCKLTEIKNDHKIHVLELINLLSNDDFTVNVETVLRHPFFTVCLDKARSRLKDNLSDSDVASTWNNEKLEEWKKSLNEKSNEFCDESFADLKDILLSETMNKSERIDEAFKTTPTYFSRYIWYLATKKTINVQQHKKNQRTITTEEKVLGEGSFGRVIRRSYTDVNGRTFSAAYKKCNDKKEAEEIFTKEIKTLKQLNHLFVIRYIDVVEENSEKYIVMELCEGTLKEYFNGKLERIPKGSLNEKIIVSQVTLGMAYIHDQGIIHKDLKPDNILLWCPSIKQELVLAKIADFGFAKQLKPGQAEFSNTAHPGTESYMAPELLNAKGTYPASFASDVYSLGVTIGYIALKGTHPFSEKKIVQQILMFHGQIPLNLEQLSWDTQHLILTLTDKDPKRRPTMNLILRHPYFVLTNDKTTWQFVDELKNMTFPKFKDHIDADENGTVSKIVLGLPEEQMLKIFSGSNFQEWYTSLASDSDSFVAADNKDEMERLSSKISFGPLIEALQSKNDYNRSILEEIKPEYNSNVESKINQIMFPAQQRLSINSLSIWLYKLIKNSPKLLSLYLWSKLENILNERQVQQPTWRDIKQTIQVDPSQNVPICKPTISMVSELKWSSLFFDDEELIDVLCGIKHGSENIINRVDLLEIIGECNISEGILFLLLDRTPNPAVRFEALSVLVMRSHFKNAPKIAERILEKTKWGEELPVYLVALNRGKHGADIMKVLLKFGGDPNAFDSNGHTPLHNATENESDSALAMVKLLLKNKATPNVRDREGFMPIHYAACNEGNDAHQIMKELLDHGGTCNATTTVELLEPIHLCVGNRGKDAEKLLDLLMEKRGTAKICAINGLMPVHFVVLNNSGDCGLKIMKKLLENAGANPNTVDDYQRTPLHLAAGNKANDQITEIIYFLLEHGGDPNATDSNGQTPVHYAAENQGQHAHLKLELLLSKGGDPTVKGYNGLAPFHVAVLNTGIRGIEIRKLLETNQNMVNDPVNKNEDTLLHCIASRADNSINIEHVKIILENGGNANAKNILGLSSVHLAVRNDSPVALSLLQLLLQNGGNPNLLDEFNMTTPVHYAASSPCKQAPEILKLLLDKGGNPNVEDKNKLTPLHLSALNPGVHAPELTKILIEHHGDPNAADNNQYTPLHWAVRNKDDQISLKIVTELLKGGGNSNLKDENGMTPIHYVVIENGCNSLEILRLLVENGGDDNVFYRKDNETTQNQVHVDHDGESPPSHLAIQTATCQTIGIMKIDNRNRGNPNATDNKDETPVHYAACNKGEQGPEKLKYLLKSGGDLTVVNEKGLTPLHYALLNTGDYGSELRKILHINEDIVNAPINQSGDTLLHCVINNSLDNSKQLEYVQVLLENGANPNVTNEHGLSSLHIAASHKDSPFAINLLKLLLEKGGNPNLPDKENGETPVHYAACNEGEQAPEKLKYLLKGGGDLTVVNKKGLTPLHYALLNPGDYGFEIRRNVPEGKINDPLNENGDSLLHCLIVNNLDNSNQLNNVRILLGNGANPNVTNTLGYSPVHLIATSDSPIAQSLLELLFEKGGDPNLPNKAQGSTAVHFAACNQGKHAPEILRFLLKTVEI